MEVNDSWWKLFPHAHVYPFQNTSFYQNHSDVIDIAWEQLALVLVAVYYKDYYAIIYVFYITTTPYQIMPWSFN